MSNVEPKMNSSSLFDDEADAVPGQQDPLQPGDAVRGRAPEGNPIWHPFHKQIFWMCLEG